MRYTVTHVPNPDEGWKSETVLNVFSASAVRWFLKRRFQTMQEYVVTVWENDDIVSQKSGYEWYNDQFKLNR